jgi:diaminopimelate decarboxylase/aspartate kinase
LAKAAEQFPEVRVLNLGGGLGVPEKPGQHPLDLGAVDQSLAAVKAAHPGLSLWIEPGRFVVAECGALLARVNQVKEKEGVAYVGVDAGMNTLIRPALYGAYHHIVNLTRLQEDAAGSVHVVGPICETGDTLGYDRPLPATQEGDILLIATAGAYGAVMSSDYNLRPRAAETLLP